MKSKNKKVLVAVGVIALIAVVGLAFGSKQGGLFQGRLTSSSSKFKDQVVETLPVVEPESAVLSDSDAVAPLSPILNLEANSVTLHTSQFPKGVPGVSGIHFKFFLPEDSRAKRADLYVNGYVVSDNDLIDFSTDFGNARDGQFTLTPVLPDPAFNSNRMLSFALSNFHLNQKFRVTFNSGHINFPADIKLVLCTENRSSCKVNSFNNTNIDSYDVYDK